MAAYVSRTLACSDCTTCVLVGGKDKRPPFTHCALKLVNRLARQANAVSVTTATKQGIPFQPLRWCAVLFAAVGPFVHGVLTCTSAPQCSGANKNHNNKQPGCSIYIHIYIYIHKYKYINTCTCVCMLEYICESMSHFISVSATKLK